MTKKHNEKAQSDFDDKLKNALKKKLNNEKILIMKELKKKLQEEQQELSIAAMKKELDEQNNKLNDFNLQQIEIEKIKREKEQLKTELNAEFPEKFNEDLVKEKEVVFAKNEKDRVELTIIEQNKKIENLVKELDNAKKGRTRFNANKGEVQEIAIEEWIENQFPLDSVEEVKKVSAAGIVFKL